MHKNNIGSIRSVPMKLKENSNTDVSSKIENFEIKQSMLDFFVSLRTQLIDDIASSYINGATDRKALDGKIEGYKQFDWSVSLLAQHWYLNRQEATSERMPTTVQALIQQMRGVYYATH